MSRTAAIAWICFILSSIPTIASVSFVELKPLPQIVNLFHGCDIYLVNFRKGDFQLTNLKQVQHPFKFYTNRGAMSKYVNASQQINKVAANVYFEGGALEGGISLPQLSKSCNCKAQILLAWKAPGLIHGPMFHIREYTRIYTVLVHGISLKMDRPRAVQRSKRLLYWKRSRIGVLNLRYFYHVIVSLAPIENQTGLQLQSNPLLEAKKYVLLSKCFYCSGGFSDPFLIGDSDDGILASMANRVTTHGVHNVHYNLLRPVLRSSIIQFVGLAESQSYTLSLKRGPFDTYYADIKEKEVLQGKKYTLLQESTTPEELVVFSLKTKYSNMSITWPTTKAEISSFMNALLFASSSEFVAGPVFYATKYVSSTNVIPTDNIGLVFVTSENVTVTERTDIFAAPFDRSIWVLTLVCTLAAAAVLYLTSVNDGRGGRSLDTMAFIWRIFLENYHDVAEGARGNSKVYSILALIIALVGVVMSNAYKGVLTSDLSSSPTYAGPTDLGQLVVSNWTFISIPSSRKPVNSARIHTNNEALNDFAESLSMVLNFALVSTMAELKFRENGRRIFHSPGHLRRFFAHPGYVGTDAWKTCNMSREAFWTFSTESTLTMSLPKQCLPVLKRKAFVVGRDRFGAANVGWSMIGMQRPGEAFKAIKRLVETGVYNGLRGILTRRKEGLSVEDFVIKPLEPPVQKLTTSSPLVASSFDLWWKMLVAALVVFIVEGACGILKTLFTFSK